MFYINAIHYSFLDNGVVKKPTAYEILGLTPDGQKEILTVQIEDNENAKYGLSVLNEADQPKGKGYPVHLCR